MKIGFAHSPQNWSAAWLVPVAFLCLTSCQNQKTASASLTGTGSAVYPDAVPPLAPAPATFGQTTEENTTIQTTKIKPFSLREGEELISYKVVPGDTLGKIATAHNTSVTRIKSANGLSSDTIIAGKTYKIPTQKGSAPAPADGSDTITSRVSEPPKPAPASTRYGLPAEPPAGNTSLGEPSSPAYNPPSLSTSNTYIPPGYPQDSTTHTREYETPTITIPTTGGTAFPQPTFGSGSF